MLTESFPDATMDALRAWFRGKKLGKRPELNQYHFPGCVLEVFEGLDVNGQKRLHLDLNLEGA
jgi:hypothetical protein